MNLLFLLPSAPDPPISGARLRNLSLLRLAAAAGHTVDALAFGSGSPADHAALADLADRAVLVPPPPPRGLRARLVTAAGRLPDMADRLRSPHLLGALRSLLASRAYDGVQAEGIEMARYLAVVPPARRVYDAHNPEFLLQRRASQAARMLAGPRAPVAWAYSRLQWRRLERFEGRVVAGSRLTLAVSYHDANLLDALAESQAPPRRHPDRPAWRPRVEVVPSAVEVAHYPFRLPSPDDPPALLFVGTLAYRPNAESVRWLLERVLPRLHRRLPTARLFVVGQAPPRWLVAAGQADDRVVVTGGVPDERPYLARASVLVLPLVVAAGARLKALVGMAAGLPIVSTPVGMEGLDARAGEHFVLADGAGAWADALADLLADASRRQALARAGRALVERAYTPSAVAPALARAYAALGEPC